MKYTLSQTAANKVREVINRRTDSGGIDGAAPRITGNNSDYILVTADNEDGTYSGTIQRYVTDAWVSYGEVTVVDANDAELTIGERYQGIRYGVALYVVGTGVGTDGGGEGASSCSANCNGIPVPYTYTVTLNPTNDECSDCEDVSGDYVLVHQGEYVWAYSDSDVSLELTIIGREYHPQATLTVTVCDTEYTYEMVGRVELQNCFPELEQCDCEEEAPEGTADYDTWSAGGAFTPGKWTAAYWTSPVGPDNWYDMFAWQEGDNPTFDEQIDTETVVFAGGFDTWTAAICWARCAVNVLPDFAWFSYLPPHYDDDCTMEPSIVLPEIPGYGTYWDQAATSGPWPNIFNWHSQFTDYTDPQFGWYKLEYGDIVDRFPENIEPVIGSWLVVVCCKAQNYQTIQTEEAEHPVWFTYGTLSPATWSYITDLYADYREAWVIGPFFNAQWWVMGLDTGNGPALFEASFGYPADECGGDGGGSGSWSYPCQVGFAACVDRTEWANCCGSNTLLLMTDDAACNMASEVTLTPGDEVIYLPYPPPAVVDGGEF